MTGANWRSRGGGWRWDGPCRRQGHQSGEDAGAGSRKGNEAGIASQCSRESRWRRDCLRGCRYQQFGEGGWVGIHQYSEVGRNGRGESKPGPAGA